MGKQRDRGEYKWANKEIEESTSGQTKRQKRVQVGKQRSPNIGEKGNRKAIKKRPTQKPTGTTNPIR